MDASNTSSQNTLTEENDLAVNLSKFLAKLTFFKVDFLKTNRDSRRHFELILFPVPFSQTEEDE